MLVAFCFLSVLIVACAVVGGVRTYSPIPYWDMWNGYLEFYLKASQSDVSVWWAQHNEHRILWSRLLFWLDIRWFGGTSAFLIVINYILVGIAGIVFSRLLAWSLPEPSMRTARWAISIFLFGWLFLWSQSENFTWGFQSQFFLAQLLPLCALVALYRSAKEPGKLGLFLLACLLGAASLGSMANGVIVLPLMVLCGGMLRIGRARLLSLLVLAIGGGLLYFQNYSSPPGNGSLFATLLANPADVTRSMLLYLGSPFFFLMRKSSHSVQIALGAGVVLLVASLIWGIAAIRRRPTVDLRLALLSYLLFIGGTALATAIGRLQFGPDQILSSRYSTPAVMAWGVFFVLLADSMRSRLNRRPITWLLVLLALHVYVAVVQVRNVPGISDTDYRRHLAALALELGARDDGRIATVFPYIDWVLDIAVDASRAQASIFDRPPLRGVRARMGAQANSSNASDCSAGIDYVYHLDGGDYHRIAGWVSDDHGGAVEGVWIVDHGGKRVGYALAFNQAASLGKGADAGRRFDGYVTKESVVELGAIQVAGSACAAKLESTSSWFTVWPAQPPVSTDVVAGSAAILANDGWTGSDYQRTAIDGFQVVGSHRHGDDDSGTLKLKLKPGESVFYRSGPVMRSQFLKFGQAVRGWAMLPAAENWVRLVFQGAALPAEGFEVTFTDAGKGFGEWSAIALRANK